MLIRCFSVVVVVDGRIVLESIEETILFERSAMDVKSCRSLSGKAREFE